MRRPPGFRALLGKAENKDVIGVDKDIDVFTRTIQRYLTKYQRWNSPKFIIGESYGTTRAAGLVDSLLNAGVQLNGITFISTVFNFADFQGDQSMINFLPTYAADAWYHGKIPGKPPLEPFLQQAREFASGPYALALQKGNAISSDARRQSVAQQMAQLTGLSADYIVRSNLRVDPGRFRRELLRDRHQIIGRIDSRYLGTEPDRSASRPITIRRAAPSPAAFVGALNDYLFARSRLQDAADLPAEQLCGGIRRGGQLELPAQGAGWAAADRRHQRRSRGRDAAEPAHEDPVGQRAL